MALRVTSGEVEAILETNLTGTNLTPFIAAANRVVEDRLVGKTYTTPAGATATIDATTLKEIERWLAAHFTAMWDKRTVEDEVGPARFAFEGQTAMRLDFTRYGQQAIILDPTDTLAGLGSDPDLSPVSFFGSATSDRDWPPGSLPYPTTPLN